MGLYNISKSQQHPKYAAVQVYSVKDSPLCLTGTAEVPLGAMYMDQILAEQQLPIKLAGFGHCFRTEAGAGGVHQFLLSIAFRFSVCWKTPEAKKKGL